MTVFTRYVNTASTAGGDGTTNNTTGATRAFAYLDTALNTCATTIADGDEWIFECCGTAADTHGTAFAQHSTTPLASRWTINNGTGKITIRANRGHAAGFYDGPLAYSTAHYRLELGSGSPSVWVSTPNTTIDGIQVKTTGNPSQAIDMAHGSACKNVTIKNCRLKGQSSTGVGIRAFNSYLSTVTNQVVVNNIVQGYTKGIEVEGPGAGYTTCYIYNNTVVNATTGVNVGANLASGVVNVRNNIFSSCATAASLTAGSGTITATFNAYDTGHAGAATGTAVSDWTAAFTDPASGDYTLKPGSPLIGGGVSATADSKVPGQDLLGRARAPGACDLGVFSFVTQTAIQEPVWSVLSFV